MAANFWCQYNMWFTRRKLKMWRKLLRKLNTSCIRFSECENVAVSILLDLLFLSFMYLVFNGNRSWIVPFLARYILLQISNSPLLYLIHLLYSYILYLKNGILKRFLDTLYAITTWSEKFADLKGSERTIFFEKICTYCSAWFPSRAIHLLQRSSNGSTPSVMSNL